MGATPSTCSSSVAGGSIAVGNGDSNEGGLGGPVGQKYNPDPDVAAGALGTLD